MSAALQIHHKLRQWPTKACATVVLRSLGIKPASRTLAFAVPSRTWICLNRDAFEEVSECSSTKWVLPPLIPGLPNREISTNPPEPSSAPKWPSRTKAQRGGRGGDWRSYGRSRVEALGPWGPGFLGPWGPICRIRRGSSFAHCGVDDKRPGKRSQSRDACGWAYCRLRPLRQHTWQ